MTTSLRPSRQYAAPGDTEPVSVTAASESAQLTSKPRPISDGPFARLLSECLIYARAQDSKSAATFRNCSGDVFVVRITGLLADEASDTAYYLTGVLISHTSKTDFGFVPEFVAGWYDPQLPATKTLQGGYLIFSNIPLPAGPAR